MTVLELQKIYDEKMSSIKAAYEQKLSGIFELEHEINDFAMNHTNNSKKWIDEKTKVLQQRLIKAKSGAEKFLNTKMAQLQEWLDNSTAEVEDWVQKKGEALVKAALGVSV